MRQLIFLISVFLTISGCSSVPTQTFNAEANANIQNIAVVNPPVVDEVNVQILTHPGQSFGIIGGLVAAADMASKTSRYNESLQSKFDWDSYITQQIRSEIGRVGYKVSTASLRKPGSKEMSFVDKYGDLPADAAFDFYYSVGQLASGATTNYVPTVRLRARLTDLKSQSVVYEQQFSAGLATNQEEINFPSGGKEYPNIATLVANSPESVEALKVGIQQIAKRIASDLAK